MKASYRGIEVNIIKHDFYYEIYSDDGFEGMEGYDFVFDSIYDYDGEIVDETYDKNKITIKLGI